MLYLTFAWLCSKSLSGVQVLFGVDATDLATLPQATGHRYTVEGLRSSLMSGMTFFQQILPIYFVVFLWSLRIRLDSLAQEIREQPFDRIIFQFPQHKERNKAGRRFCLSKCHQV